MSFFDLPAVKFSTRSRPKGASSGSQKSGCGCSELGNPSGTAKAAFLALDANCTTAEAVLGAQAWGPFSGSGSCSYDCGFMEWDWWWKAPDYSNYIVQNYVGPAIQSMALSQGYTQAFQGAQQWVGQDLPSYNSSLTGSLNQILHIDAAILQQGGQATPAQTEALNTAFASINTQLRNSSAEANGALQTLAAFLNSQQGRGGFPASTAVSCHQAIVNACTKTENDLIGESPCGSGDIQDSFNGMFGVLTQSFAAVVPSLNAIDSAYGTAMQAGQSVAGCFLVFQADGQMAAVELQKAQSFPPTSPLRTLHLNNFASDWTDLVNSASGDLVAQG